MSDLSLIVMVVAPCLVALVHVVLGNWDVFKPVDDEPAPIQLGVDLTNVWNHISELERQVDSLKAGIVVKSAFK